MPILFEGMIWQQCGRKEYEKEICVIIMCNDDRHDGIVCLRAKGTGVGKGLAIMRTRIWMLPLRL